MKKGNNGTFVTYRSHWRFCLQKPKEALNHTGHLTISKPDLTVFDRIVREHPLNLKGGLFDEKIVLSLTWTETKF